MKKKGSRIEVMNGIAEMTGGGLKKKDLMYKDGKIISKKMNKKIYKQRGGDDDCRDLAYGVYNALHEDENLPQTTENDSIVLEYITKKRTLEDPSNLPTGDDRPDFIKDLIDYNNKHESEESKRRNVYTISSGRNNSNIKNNYQNTELYKFLNYLQEVNSQFHKDYEDIIFDSLLYLNEIEAELAAHVNNPRETRGNKHRHKTPTSSQQREQRVAFNVQNKVVLTNAQKIETARIKAEEIEPTLPSGWIAYASTSRPGGISYYSSHLMRRQAQRPTRSAYSEKAFIDPRDRR